MLSLLQSSLLKQSSRVLCGVGRRPLIRPLHAPQLVLLRPISPLNQVVTRYYSSERDKGDEQDKPAGTKTTNNVAVDTPKSEPALPAAKPSSLVVTDMPGTNTPFDPNAQLKDGEYVALFLHKRNELKPLTALLRDTKESSSTDTQASEVVEDTKGRKKGKKLKAEKKSEKPVDNAALEPTVELDRMVPGEPTEPVVEGVEPKTTETQPETTEKPSETASTVKDEEPSGTSETKADEAALPNEAKADKTVEPTSEAKELETKPGEEGEKSSTSTSVELLPKRQSEFSAMVDSTAVHDVGVLAQVDKTAISGPRLKFLYPKVPVRLCSTNRPGLGAKIEIHKSEPYDAAEAEELMTKVKAALTTALEAFPTILKASSSETLLKQKEPNRFVFGLMADLAEAQAVLSSNSTPRRLAIALAVVETDMAVRQKQQEINKELEERTTKEQREFFLREQLKMVRKELGERDEKEELIEKYRARLSDKVPKEAMKVIEDELAKLQMLEPASSEYSITRNYLDWLTILPWGVNSKDSFDLKRAAKVLEEEHYGLKDIKTRILEFIAVGSLKGTVQGKIICLIGPPGVGKTSIGKSIANALDRKFFRFSVGGMNDVSEIKGHRRTYVGAMPGKLLQCLKQVKVSNPVVLIDEIDKLGKGRQGDPASALLEVLDPEQNVTFMDHYLDVPVDLSKVLFICTANMRDPIPKPLLDRMEVMYLSGYIPAQQTQIVKNYLIPAAVKAAGLQPAQIVIEDSAIEALVKSYCREAGVRNLQKHVEKITRKVALKRVRGTKTAVVIKADNIAQFVGKPVFSSDRYYDKAPAGIIMGLAWTQLGGAALYVETVQDPLQSRAEMRITGQLGDVMKESTSIAYTYAKNHLEVVSPGSRFFEGASLHMHIPEGATPKDGPSAGITMVTSLLSLALDQPVIDNLAMTGELTLTGKVLPIGGVCEKCIAAKRAGVKTLILPEGNKKHWTELPDNIKKGLTVHFADYYKDVFEVAFANMPKTKTKAKSSTTTTPTKTKSKPTKPTKPTNAKTTKKSTTATVSPKSTKSSATKSSATKSKTTKPVTKPTKQVPTKQTTKTTKPVTTKPTKQVPTKQTTKTTSNHQTDNKITHQNTTQVKLSSKKGTSNSVGTQKKRQKN